MVHNLVLASMVYMPLVLAAFHGAVPSKRDHSSEARCRHRKDFKSDKDSKACQTVVSGWYAGWHASDYPLASINWKKYSSVRYAVATTTPDPSTIYLQDYDKALLPKFVHAAHEKDVAAILSIGGWDGSVFFSTAVGSTVNRTLFVEAILNLVSTYKLDGIDFDWEYPGKQGIGCNKVSPHDSSNFLAMLQELRSHEAGRKMTISAAVSLTPFAGTDGKPMADVSAFAMVLDYVEIMGYDVWGSWSSGVGPNSPLDDSCAPAADQVGSVVSAVNAWTSARFPVNQIVLGVPSYGHSYFVARSKATVNGIIAQYPAFNKSLQPVGDPWDAPPGVDVCGAPTPQGGIFDFWGLIKGGFLAADGTAAQDILYRYDKCSQTPYVYNLTSQVMVSYDDATSFAAKGDFIKKIGLKGAAMWTAQGDYQDILLDAISKSLGTNGD